MRDPNLVHSFDGPAADVLRYCFPVVSILGLIGNCLSPLTVISKRCNKSSFTVYIAALAVVDSCMLIANLADTLLLAVSNLNLGHHGIAICKVIKFSQASFRHASAWIIIAITTERVIATIYPFRFNAIYSTRFGVKVVGTLAGLTAILNAHFLYGAGYSYWKRSLSTVFTLNIHDRLLFLNYAFCHIKRLIKTSEPVYTD